MYGYKTTCDELYARDKAIGQIAPTNDCKDEVFLEVEFASLFTTIAAFTIILDNHDLFGYTFDYTISDGTLLAAMRNEMIFAWDTDVDLYLLFDDNLDMANLERFRQDLQNVMYYLLSSSSSTTNNYTSNLHDLKPTLIDDINIDESKSKYLKMCNKYMHSYCQTLHASNENINLKNNKPCILWNNNHGHHMSHVSKNNWFHSLHIEVSPLITSGYVDIFIMYKDETNTKMRSDHCCIEPFHNFTNISFVFPSKYYNWQIYDNIELRIPRQVEKLLELEFGKDWIVPDVDKKHVNCPNVDEKVVINQWMQEKYRNIIDVIRRDTAKIRQDKLGIESANSMMRYDHVNGNTFWGSLYEPANFESLCLIMILFVILSLINRVCIKRYKSRQK